MRSSQTLTPMLKRFQIQSYSQPGIAIKKQLRIEEAQKSFSFSDPTIVRIQESRYLTLTQLGQDGMPCLCFYRLNANSSTVDDNPSFKIERAELFLGCDSSGAVSYLTNAALLDAKSSSKLLDFNRLKSPSQIVTVHFELLERLKGMTTVK